MEARTRYDFIAVVDEELDIKKGDIIKILKFDKTWCKAELNGQEGIIPFNYIDVKLPKWFQNNLSRSDAEKMLKTKCVGAYFVRFCPTSPENFCISIKHESGFQHYRILRNKKGEYFLWKEKFFSLNKLVDFYKSNSISKSKIIHLCDDEDDVDAADESEADDVVPDTKRTIIADPRVMLVRALCDFFAAEESELSFEKGDLIEVMEFTEARWWTGKRQGKTGLFPANYTEPV
ncbi:protein E(sev)2B-like [Pholidichthys leucotaenia]